MYSKAWTIKNTVVHAPGLGRKSRSESVNHNLGLKNGIQFQYFNNRDRAANRAYKLF